jgi:methylated-DNA-[protein]-cysteine S-methyltransferase
MTRPTTRFEDSVYEAARLIPPGRVSTYKLIADYLDCGSAQAIGQALRRNPYAPEVPCHRVIRSDLTLGGFDGHSAGPATKKKLRLLEQEGVLFDSRTRRLKSPQQVFDF